MAAMASSRVRSLIEQLQSQSEEYYNRMATLNPIEAADADTAASLAAQRADLQRIVNEIEALLKQHNMMNLPLTPPVDTKDFTTLNSQIREEIATIDSFITAAVPTRQRIAANAVKAFAEGRKNK